MSVTSEGSLCKPSERHRRMRWPPPDRGTRRPLHRTGNACPTSRDQHHEAAGTREPSGRADLEANLPEGGADDSTRVPRPCVLHPAALHAATATERKCPQRAKNHLRQVWFLCLHGRSGSFVLPCRYVRGFLSRTLFPRWPISLPVGL